MTIRALMLATLAMAFAFSMLAWNWGISVFAAACIPLVACFVARKFLSRLKALRVVAIALSVGLIYLFSHGPYIALLEAVYGESDRPPAVDAITRTIYAPFGALFARPKSGSAPSPGFDEIREFFDAYGMEWQWFGSDIGVFVRALFFTA